MLVEFVAKVTQLGQEKIKKLRKSLHEQPSYGCFFVCKKQKPFLYDATFLGPISIVEVEGVIFRLFWGDFTLIGKERGDLKHWTDKP